MSELEAIMYIAGIMWFMLFMVIVLGLAHNWYEGKQKRKQEKDFWSFNEYKNRRSK